MTTLGPKSRIGNPKATSSCGCLALEALSSSSTMLFLKRVNPTHLGGILGSRLDVEGDNSIIGFSTSISRVVSFLCSLISTLDVLMCDIMAPKPHLVLIPLLFAKYCLYICQLD